MGSMTQGVQAGIAAYQNGVRLKQLKELQAQQAMMGGIQTLNKILGMPRNLRGPMLDQYGEDIARMTGKPISQTLIESFKKADEEQAGTLREVFAQAGLEMNPQQMMDLMGDPYKALDFAMKVQKGKHESATIAKRASVMQMGGDEGGGEATPAAPPEMADSEPSGSMAPLPMPAPAPAPAPMAAAPAPAQEMTLPAQLNMLNSIEDKANAQMDRLAAQGEGLTKQEQDYFTTKLGALDKRRSAIADQLKQANPELKETEVTVNGRPMRVFVNPRNPQAPPVPIGPVVRNAQSEVGKLQADRQALIDQGAGEGSPAVKAIDSQIQAAGTGDDKTAQSPIGKAIDDYARAVRIYGEGSPQAAAVKTVVDQMKGQGQVTQSDVGNMRGQFTQASTRFISVRDAIGQIESSAKKPSNIGDLGVMTGYMKLIDPGSTVRENEMANAQNAAAVPERIRAIWNKLQGGGSLSAETRKEFVGKSREIFAGYTRNQQALMKQYEGIAKGQGIDPSQVVLDFINSSGATTAPDLPAAKATAESSAKDLEDTARAFLRKRGAQP